LSLPVVTIENQYVWIDRIGGMKKALISDSRFEISNFKSLILHIMPIHVDCSVGKTGRDKPCPYSHHPR
jgi:hypothetical protein